MEKNIIMSKNKLIARAIEYYGNALTELSKASNTLDKVHASLKRAYGFLEDQEQLMKRFKIDSTDAKDMKDEVNHLLAEVETLTDHIDDTAMGVEMRQQEYQDAM